MQPNFSRKEELQLQMETKIEQEKEEEENSWHKKWHNSAWNLENSREKTFIEYDNHEYLT